MDEVSHALRDVKDLFQKVVGRPAPEIGPDSYAPFPVGVEPMVHATQEVDYLKRISEPFLATTTRWVPRADSFVTDDAFVVQLEVPGVAREDLKVLYARGECIVRGERKPVGRSTELRQLTVERPWGPFERRFVLPAGSHPEQLSARYHDGILELRVKLDQARTPKEMEIDVG